MLEIKEQMEEIITQTIDAAMSTIPEHLKDIERNDEVLKVENPQEFIYGMVMGMALGVSGVVFSSMKGQPTEEDQMMIRDIIYKIIPQVRERIFE